MRFDRKLHWQFLQHFADKAVDQQGYGLFFANPALADIEELIIGELGPQ